jgi:Helix-turn-helix domain
MTTRKMRIAADIAHGWARNFKLGDPLAKLVLMATTLYVNDEGCCFVGISTLAEDTELSENTVRRKLVWLEEIRAIKRRPQWIDPHGRRTSDRVRGGKCTSDEIRLCLDVDPAEIEIRAGGKVTPGDAVSPPTEIGLADQSSPFSVVGLKPVSPALALQQPSHSWEGLTPFNNELEDSDAYASDAGAPRDVRTDLFNRGLKILAAITGKTPDSCRSLIGKWLKSVNDEAIHVLGAIEDAERNRIADPVPWITRALTSNTNNRIGNGTYRNGGGFALNTHEFAQRAARQTGYPDRS